MRRALLPPVPCPVLSAPLYAASRSTKQRPGHLHKKQGPEQAVWSEITLLSPVNLSKLKQRKDYLSDIDFNNLQIQKNEVEWNDC
jgi:hypothetical protein